MSRFSQQDLFNSSRKMNEAITGQVPIPADVKTTLSSLGYHPTDDDEMHYQTAYLTARARALGDLIEFDAVDKSDRSIEKSMQVPANDLAKVHSTGEEFKAYVSQ